MDDKGNNNSFGYSENNAGRNTGHSYTDPFSLISSGSSTRNTGTSGYFSKPAPWVNTNQGQNMYTNTYTGQNTSANTYTGNNGFTNTYPGSGASGNMYPGANKGTNIPSGAKNGGRTNAARSQNPQSKPAPAGQKGSSPKKQGAGNQRTASSGKAPKSGGVRRQTNGRDVLRDRISDGKRTSPEGNNPNTANNRNQKAAQGKQGNHQKNAQGRKGNPQNAANRTPQGRDTRNPGKQRKPDDRAKSTEKYKRGRHDGNSHDDMVNTTAKSKRNKAKIIAGITVSVVVLFVLAFAGVYVYNNGATVEVITIEGENRYKDAKITEVANVYVGQNMLSVRQKAVNDAVTKALPYISAVEVDYQFPETLVLRVTSTQEKLLITNGSGFICVDENDKILSLKKKKLTDGRYRIDGLTQQQVETGDIFVPDEYIEETEDSAERENNKDNTEIIDNKDRYTKAKEIVRALDGIEGFSSGIIDVSNLRSITYTYDSRIKIYLGKAENPLASLTDAMSIIKENVAEGQTGYIDMRFDIKTYFAPGSMDIK